MGFCRNLSDKKLEEKYLSIGYWVGGALSYSHLGKPMGIRSKIRKLSRLEKEYSRRGYRTISIDDFISYGGFEKDINCLVGNKRDTDENPILYFQK